MKSKLFIFFVITFSLTLTAFSQQYKYIYYFDKDLNSCRKADAIITGRGFWDSGHFILDYYVTATEKLLMSSQYTDSTLSNMNGIFRSYYSDAEKTVLEEEGNYANDQKQGLWQKWDKKGMKTDSVIYEKGNRMVFAKFGHYDNGLLSYYEITDSLKNIFYGQAFSEKGELTFEKQFIGEKGILKFYDSSGIRTDSVFTREEIEAEPQGGQKGWLNYLKANLKADVASNNNAPAGQYEVVVKFVVTKTGEVTNVIAENAPGYGTEKEAIRVIKNSPKWKPAKQYGRYVNAYRRQPITFLVSY